MGDLFGDYAPSYEMILYCNNGNKEFNNGRDSNILRTSRTNNENHPTEKPVNLMKYLIEKSTKEGDLVLDTFAGSFTTAKACIETNRNYICCDIEKKYCENAEKLIKNYTKTLF